MFETNANADETVFRHRVLKTAAGLVAGSTVLAGLGAGRGAAETEEGLRLEVREFTEENIAVEVAYPDDYWDDIKPLNPVYLGHAERFVLHDDGEWVSLPEDTEALANPVEWERLDEQTYRMYFRTAEVDLSEADGEEVTLGVGIFTEPLTNHSIPRDQYGETFVSDLAY